MIIGSFCNFVEYISPAKVFSFVINCNLRACRSGYTWPRTYLYNV